MSERIALPGWVVNRINDKLNEPGRAGRYDKWLRLMETAECVMMLRDVFGRPQEVQGELTGRKAIRAQGYQEGAFAVLDTLTSLNAPDPTRPEPIQDYGVSEDKSERGEKGRAE